MFIIQGSQGGSIRQNSKDKTDRQVMEEYNFWLVPPGDISLLSYTLQIYLSAIGWTLPLQSIITMPYRFTYRKYYEGFFSVKNPPYTCV